MAKKVFDIRNLPSWKYFAWGLLNGLFLGILIKHKIDISETGIISQILEAFKPIFQSVNFSISWISSIIFIFGIISIISLIIEIINIYNKGWPQRIIALSGFLSFLFLIIGLDTLGVIFLLGGGFLVMIFPKD